MTLRNLFKIWVWFLKIGLLLEEHVSVWVCLNDLEHKMYKYCDSVQKRFEKFIEKARMKHSSFWNLYKCETFNLIKTITNCTYILKPTVKIIILSILKYI